MSPYSSSKCYNGVEEQLDAVFDRFFEIQFGSIEFASASQSNYKEASYSTGGHYVAKGGARGRKRNFMDVVADSCESSSQNKDSCPEECNDAVVNEVATRLKHIGNELDSEFKEKRLPTLSRLINVGEYFQFADALSEEIGHERNFDTLRQTFYISQCVWELRPVLEDKAKQFFRRFIKETFSSAVKDKGNIGAFAGVSKGTGTL